eukprot:COSAG05_NODE_14194_length_404_cov_1.426230_1_plen_76_part_00
MDVQGLVKTLPSACQRIIEDHGLANLAHQVVTTPAARHALEQVNSARLPDGSKLMQGTGLVLAASVSSFGVATFA